MANVITCIHGETSVGKPYDSHMHTRKPYDVINQKVYVATVTIKILSSTQKQRVMIRAQGITIEDTVGCG